MEVRRQRLMSHYFNIPHNVVPMAGGDAFLFNETWESNNFTHRKGYKGPYNPDVKRYDPKNQYGYSTNQMGGQRHVADGRPQGQHLLCL